MSTFTRSTISKQDYETPDWFFEFFNHHYHFVWDIAASASNTKVEDNFWSEDNNALLKSWSLGPLWLNPPYRGLGLWASKIIEETQLRNKGTVVVSMLPASTGTVWFRKLWDTANTVYFITGRVAFEVNGEPAGSPTMDNVVFEHSYPHLGPRTGPRVVFLNRDTVEEIGRIYLEEKKGQLQFPDNS